MEENYQEIIREMANSELFKYLELRFLHLTRGFCEMYFEIEEKFLNKWGEVDQKILYLVCDVAAFATAKTVASRGEIPIHYSVNLFLLAPVSDGGLRVQAQTLGDQAGGYIESHIWDDNNQVIVSGSFRFMRN
jgi:hypothetical protein